MIKPTLYIPVALPGAGKTTWTQRLLAHAGFVSSDAIRNDLFPGPYNPENNERVFAEYHDEISRWAFIDMVADATNLESRARHKLYHIAAQHKADTHILLFTNKEQALERNQKRTGSINGEFRVPDEAMLTKMIPRYEQTLNDIHLEPYTYITEIARVA